MEKEWTQTILEWEKDSTKTNPYLSVVARKYNTILIYHLLPPVSRCLSGRGEESATRGGEECSHGWHASATRNGTDGFHFDGTNH